MENNSNYPLMPSPQQYVFPSAYGGAVQSDKPPQIHNMMRQLRLEIGAVEAVKSQDKYGPKFPVRGAKDLAQKLANALNKLNMEAPVVSQEVNLLETAENKIPQNERPNGQPVFRTLAHVKATVRIIAPDTSFIDVVGSGHGGDVDDKSGGKASTYAWKDALLKGLSIPHEDMVDTDDDSSTGGEEPAGSRKASGKAAAARSKNAVDKSAGRSESKVSSNRLVESAVDNAADTEPESDETGLAYVLDKIKGANSASDLESIRDAIKTGVLDLRGSDRLEATKAWMQRKKEIDA